MLQQATQETYALHLILQRVIVDAVGRNALNANASAIEAAQAFRAGLAAFTAPREACAKDASHAQQQHYNSMAAAAGVANRDPSQHSRAAGHADGQAAAAAKDAIPQQSAAGRRFPASLDTHIGQAAQQHAKSIARLAALRRMADAAVCDQDQDRAAWVLLLGQASTFTLKATQALDAVLDAFDAPAEPVTGVGAKGLDQFSKLQRLADAAGNLAFDPINESTVQSQCQQGCSGTASDEHTQRPKNPSAPVYP